MSLIHSSTDEEMSVCFDFMGNEIPLKAVFLEIINFK